MALKEDTTASLGAYRFLLRGYGNAWKRDGKHLGLACQTIAGQSQLT